MSAAPPNGTCLCAPRACWAPLLLPELLASAAPADKLISACSDLAAQANHSCPHAHVEAAAWEHIKVESDGTRQQDRPKKSEGLSFSRM